MTRVADKGWVLVGGWVLALALVLTLGCLAGCGGDSGSSSSQSADTNTGIIDRSAAGGPSIAGIPQTTAVAGQPYSFAPKVSNTAGAVSFSVQHLPSWAKFDKSTGALSGTPNANQVGEYGGITISLLADNNTVSLPAFTITVATTDSQANAVTLSWDPPTANADGTALVDLKGYKVHYGPTSRSYSKTVEVSNPGLTTYVVDNLPTGTYYFAVTAYNSTGVESSLSGEISTMVD
jgi:hypothetical protein